MPKASKYHSKDTYLRNKKKNRGFGISAVFTGGGGGGGDGNVAMVLTG